MINSREKFEALYGPMGFDLTRKKCEAPEPWSEYEDEKTGYAWAGWLAGRESMRDEAADHCDKKSEEYRIREGRKYPEFKTDAQFALEQMAETIKEIQP